MRDFRRLRSASVLQPVSGRHRRPCLPFMDDRHELLHEQVQGICSTAKTIMRPLGSEYRSRNNTPTRSFPQCGTVDIVSGHRMGMEVRRTPFLLSPSFPWASMEICSLHPLFSIFSSLKGLRSNVHEEASYIITVR